MTWTTTKPTVPGEYRTRHAVGNDRAVNTVMVTRRGRGLSVYCHAYRDRVPMSAIDDGELEWELVTQTGGGHAE